MERPSPASTRRVEQDAASARDPRVRAERMRLLYAHASTTSAGNLVAAIAFAIAFHAQAPGIQMWLWLTLTSVVVLARLGLARAFHRRRPDPVRWGRYYSHSSLVVGACWGFAGAWLLPSVYRPVATTYASPDLKLLLIVFMLGISAAGVAALHPSLKLARAFLLLVVAPTLICIPFHGGQADGVLFMMGIVYVLVMLRIAGTSYRTLCSSLQLRFEKADLATRLEAADREKEDLIGELSTMRDVALESSRHKSEFLATMSHEIRTPLNGMLGMLSLLEESNLAASERHFARTARSSGEALLRIINDILDFSRIEAGKLTLEHRSFDLRALVEEVGALFAASAHRRGLELACSLAHPGPYMCVGDDMRLRQILNNLVGNAIKFTQRGTVEVRVGLHSHDARHEVLFEIIDTGIGIDRQSQQRIFDSFAQADGSTTRRFGGSGLGLTICAELVRLMHGEIGVDSEPQQGSRFWFRIPLDRDDDAGEPDRPPVGAGTRVLIAVAEPTFARHVQAQLQAWDLDVEIVDTPGEATARAQQAATRGEPFAAVLLDLYLSGGRDLAVARTIVGASSAQRVVLLCPAHVAVSDDELAQAGVHDRIAKPARASELARCLIADTVTPATTLPTPSLPARFTGKVLLAEDGEVNVQLALLMLTRLGVEVDVARNGHEAVEMVKNARYDLVLMDWHMPGMDGLEATRVIRLHEQQDGQSQRVAIVAVTANSLSGDRARCLAAGMDDYLSKPFRRRDLAAVCARWLESAPTAAASA